MVLLANASMPQYNLGLEKAAAYLRRQRIDFTSGPVDLWGYGADEVWISAIFTWDLPRLARWANIAKDRAKVRLGGPAVSVMAEWVKSETGLSPHVGLAEFEREPGSYKMTFTSRGCPRHCPWCIVPQAEGQIVEYADFPPARIVLDNNFLACSVEHQERVLNQLAQFRSVDFNQGLDARLFNEEVYQQITAYVQPKPWRFACDSQEMIPHVQRALCVLRDHGQADRRKCLVYTLIGFGEGEAADRQRVQTVVEIGACPFVMRYEPLNSLKRGSHPLKWDDWHEYADFARYYNRPWIWTSELGASDTPTETLAKGTG